MRTHIRIQKEDFDVSREIEGLTKGRTDVGAVVTFTGLVRGDDGLTSLTLEHYPAMTEREIVGHVEEAARRWPLAAVTVIHRVGTLDPGARIVLVAVAASHRTASFEACEFLMDYLKTQASFWKEERRGTEAAWIEAKASDDDATKRWR